MRLLDGLTRDIRSSHFVSFGQTGLDISLVPLKVPFERSRPVTLLTTVASFTRDYNCSGGDSSARLCLHTKSFYAFAPRSYTLLKFRNSESPAVGDSQYYTSRKRLPEYEL